MTNENKPISGMTVEDFIKDYFVRRVLDNTGVYKPIYGYIQRDWIEQLINQQRQQAVEEHRRANPLDDRLNEALASTAVKRITTLELERDRLREALIGIQAYDSIAHQMEAFEGVKERYMKTPHEIAIEALSYQSPPNTSGVLEVLRALSNAIKAKNENDLDNVWDLGLVERRFEALSPELKQMVGGEE